MRFDCTGAHGLHVSPRRGGGSKLRPKHTHTHTAYRNLFFKGKYEKHTQKDAEKVSKRMVLYRGIALGRPLTPLKIYPKWAPNATTNWKSLTLKMATGDLKRQTNDPKGTSGTLTRQARSAYNSIFPNWFRIFLSYLELFGVFQVKNVCFCESWTRLKIRESWTWCVSGFSQSEIEKLLVQKWSRMILWSFWATLFWNS